jgi:hypothetical protein
MGSIIDAENVKQQGRSERQKGALINLFQGNRIDKKDKAPTKGWTVQLHSNNHTSQLCHRFLHGCGQASILLEHESDEIEKKTRIEQQTSGVAMRLEWYH